LIIGSSVKTGAERVLLLL